MDGGALLLLTLGFTTLLLIYQRAEATRKRIVGICVGAAGLAIAWYAARGSLVREIVIGLVLALVISYLFWLLVGRYNPVHSSDEIRVLGMDD
jgi:hypothetical protein